jgi:putative copper export protein
MTSANFDLTTIRLFLHVLAVTIWVGGQIVMMALLPVLRSSGEDGLPAKAAQAFQNVAWPAFAVAIFTGFWNFLAVDDPTSGWSMVFGIKFLLVIASGVAAFMHAKTTDPKMKGITGALGFVTAVAAMFLGYVL